MFVYELAIVVDMGAFYQVVGLTKNNLDNLANADEKYLKCSSAAYKMMEDAIAAGKIVRLPKSLQVGEVLPGEVNIITSTMNDLDATKQAALVKCRNVVNLNLSKLAGLTLYGFTVLNNDLISAGYVITNENREEQYLKILETADEKLISKLEEYLNYRDEIESVAAVERKFSQLRKDIRNVSTIEDINKLADEFLQMFFAND